MKQIAKKPGQAAIEYLLLLAVMVIIALTAFRTIVPGAQSETNQSFTGASASIMGDAPNTSINGPWPFDEKHHD